MLVLVICQIVKYESYIRLILSYYQHVCCSKREIFEPKYLIRLVVNDSMPQQTAGIAGLQLIHCATGRSEALVGTLLQQTNRISQSFNIYWTEVSFFCFTEEFVASHFCDFIWQGSSREGVTGYWGMSGECLHFARSLANVHHQPVPCHC